MLALAAVLSVYCIVIAVTGLRDRKITWRSHTYVGGCGIAVSAVILAMGACGLVITFELLARMLPLLGQLIASR